MPENKINIQIVYRNYKPLNNPYSSFWTNPPEGVLFYLPKANKFLEFFFPIYQRFGNLFPVNRLVNLAQTVFFKRKPTIPADFLFYIGMLPAKIPRVPFYIDLEHAYAFLNFVKISNPTYVRERINEIINILSHDNCKGIIPISQAAQQSLQDFLKKDYGSIQHKMTVIYPALPVYRQLFKDKMDHSIIPKDSSFFNLLFVGKDSVRKGIEELLLAFSILSAKYNHLRLFVVGDVPHKLLSHYHGHPKICFFKPNFSQEEIITKFFIPCDLFIMPTHADTFGMVLAEALSSGLPVIATRQFATPEIIDDGVNGLLLNNHKLFLDNPGIPNERFGSDYLLSEFDQQRIIAEIVDKVSMLIDNPGLYMKLKNNSFTKFLNNNQFSISKRNHEMERIFEINRTS